MIPESSPGSFDFSLLVEVEDGKFSRFMTGTMPCHAVPGFLLALSGLQRYLPGLRVTINDQITTHLVLEADGFTLEGGGQVIPTGI